MKIWTKKCGNDSRTEMLTEDNVGWWNGEEVACMMENNAREDGSPNEKQYSNIKIYMVLARQHKMATSIAQKPASREGS